MNSIAVLSFSIILLAIFAWYTNDDRVSCNVEGAGLPAINGYYSAVGGIYIKRGHALSFFPDFYELVNLRRDITSTASISQTKTGWSINIQQGRQPVYENIPKDPENYIFSPPASNWSPTSSGAMPAPIVYGCKGSLADSPPQPSQNRSNLELLIQRPVSSILLAVIFYYAYYLWTNRIEVDTVSFSYDAVVNGKEYWRLVTASFAHFDLWHIGFNAMTLYQMADLEEVFGSIPFAYLNADLVFITMAICVVIYHIQIFRYGREEMRFQQAVGYSCVLFAWMVTASVRMSEFCPLFFLPSLCFKTMYIPDPAALFSKVSSRGLPVNFGPLLLLVVTKLIIPRSSFTGHLSGIVIGYPLAWNMLNWLTPPMALAIMALTVLIQDQPYPWKLPGYDYVTNLSEFVPPEQLRRWTMLRVCVAILCILSVAIVFLMGFMQLLPRATFLVVAWCAIYARRCEWLTDTREAHMTIISLLMYAASGALCLVIFDIMSVSGAVTAMDLLSGGQLSDTTIYTTVLLLSAAIIVEFLFFLAAVGCLQDIKLAEPNLQQFRLSPLMVRRDMEQLGLVTCCGLCRNRAGVFYGPARTLMNASGGSGAAGSGNLGAYSHIPTAGSGDDGDEEAGARSAAMEERRRAAIASISASYPTPSAPPHSTPVALPMGNPWSGSTGTVALGQVQGHGQEQGQRYPSAPPLPSVATATATSLSGTNNTHVSEPSASESNRERDRERDRELRAAKYQKEGAAQKTGSGKSRTDNSSNNNINGSENGSRNNSSLNLRGRTSPNVMTKKEKENVKTTI